tara:strand:- start:285 stop:2018 length:1734 start_codon:yes stop_codon:yes gene_type:complete
MAQHDFEIDNSTGQNVRIDINNVLKAILTNNSGTTDPSTVIASGVGSKAFSFWADTNSSPAVLKIRNSTDNGWIELFQLDGTLTLEDGSNSAPALAFRDDLDTGLYSSAANTFNVATGGVERMELGATTIFNEDGADVDFRIEGDTEPNLFYVDAGNDRIAIGHSSPVCSLDVRGTGTDFQGIRITNTQHNTNAASTSQLKFAITNSVGERSIRIQCTEMGNNSNDLAMDFYTGGAASNNSESLAMRIDNGGKVHIGTTTGGGQFNVKNQNDTSTNALEIYNDNGIRNASFSQSSAGDGSLDLRTNAEAQNVLIRANGTSHFSGGFTGFGNSSPDHVVDVKSMGSSTPLQVDNQNASAVYIHLVNTGTSGTFLGSETISANSAAQQRNMSFYVGNTSDSATRFMQLHSEGIELQSTATQIRGANGLALNFSANSNASGMTSETLDDYEQGNWTPSVSQGITGASYSIQRGGYIKIGRFVYFQFDLAISGGTGNSTHLKIGGLPFNSESSSTFAYGGAFLNYQNAFLAQGSDVTMHIGLGDSQVKFYTQAGGSMSGNSSNVNDITANIIVNGFYMAAS